MTFFFYVVLTLFLLISTLLSVVVLMQESKSMGLGALGGGGDMGSSLFGTSTVDVVKKFTAYLAACFLILAVSLSLWASVISDKNSVVMPPIEEVQSE
ncbi:MAG: preprotein translocase subunit SecG [Chlamydiales bacterium]